MSSIARAHLPPSFAGGPRVESLDAIAVPVGITVEETEKAPIPKLGISAPRTTPDKSAP